MELWQKYLLAAGIGLFLLILAIRSAVRKNRDYKNRAFTRKLETVLQPRENIKVICPQKKGQWILTSKRLLRETPEGFTSIPLKNIRRVQGNNEAGNRTTVTAKMVSLTVKADKDYTIANTSDQFPELAAQLIKKIQKQNEKKKAGKQNEKK